MKYYEYMAKEVFAGYGIPIPEGGVVSEAARAGEIAARVGPVAIKSQILAGARGKAGGIKFADEPAEAVARAGELLGQELHGYRIDRVLVERKLDIASELYVGIAIDGAKRSPVLIGSAKGGISIEEVPESDIVRHHIDVRWGLMPFEARDFTRRLGLTGSQAAEAQDIILKLWRIFSDKDAELVEINPMIIENNGKVIAADARLNFDDDALFRHPDEAVVSEGTELELRVKELGLSYVELDGNIAVMANGAGITMATLDAINRFGGRPANFLDAGGGASVEPTAQAMEVLLSTGPRAILVNIFGGITRCDDVAKAIKQVKETRGIPVPLVVRLVGTNEEEGVRILREAGIEAFREMSEAARKVVELAEGGN